VFVALGKNRAEYAGGYRIGACRCRSVGPESQIVLSRIIVFKHNALSPTTASLRDRLATWGK
jgi:hypothetical protein